MASLIMNIWFLFVTCHHFINRTRGPTTCLSMSTNEKKLNPNSRGLGFRAPF